MAKNKIIRSFEDLEVYQRAYRLALELHKLSLNLPKIEQYVLADQLRRASKGICANLAEGFARQRKSSADFHRFIVMAIGSCDEIKVWLKFAEDLGYIKSQQSKSLRHEYAVIARMLHGLMNKWT